METKMKWNKGYTAVSNSMQANLTQLSRHLLVVWLILLWSPVASLAGPSCGIKDYESERFQALQSRMVDGYRFDIAKPPVYAANSKVYDVVLDGEGCRSDSYILVTDPAGEVVYFKRIYVPRSFEDIPDDSTEAIKADVIIRQHSGGVSCCEYLHLFQTKPEFRYLGEQPAY